MSKNNLQVVNTGLDYCYINGVPIVEAEIDINDVFKKVARISSVAVHGDPYFSRHTESQKMFSELHGEGDRISRDFLEEAAKDLLPMFIPFQRWIPEGAYDAESVEYEFFENTGDSTWNNPDASKIFVDSIKVRSTAGSGTLTFIVDGVTLGSVDLPQLSYSNQFLSYDLAAFLGGTISGGVFEYVENVRNNNVAKIIEIVVSNASGDFEYDYIICAAQYDAIGWIKALTEVGDVKLPSVSDNIRISYLVQEFTWENKGNVQVTGVTLKHNSGTADVVITYNDQSSVLRTLDNNTIGEDFFGYSDDIAHISTSLYNKSDDFCYDIIVNTLVPRILPSPRFEFDSLWNPDKIIYRYQNMDTRHVDGKLDYSPDTLKDIRVDPNIFDHVLKYLTDSLKNYMLKELYEAIGYDKKAVEYKVKYIESRKKAKFWVRSEKGLQTQRTYAGA